MKTLWRDTGRPLLMTIASVFLLWLSTWLPAATGEAAAAPVLTALAVVAVMAAASHVMRRVLFPALDLQAIGFTAIRDQNLPAAVVFAAVSLVLAVLIGASVAMLR